jgi:endogenous inhibitor of DNA gyrase (YacG/DUF329 family)
MSKRARAPEGPPVTHDCHFGVSCAQRFGYLDGMVEPFYPSKTCPICGKPAAERFRPFCSGRCKDVDLNRWLSGAYAIPAAESEDDSDGQQRDQAREQMRNKESD